MCVTHSYWRWSAAWVMLATLYVHAASLLSVAAQDPLDGVQLRSDPMRISIAQVSFRVRIRMPANVRRSCCASLRQNDMQTVSCVIVVVRCPTSVLWRMSTFVCSKAGSLQTIC